MSKGIYEELFEEIEKLKNKKKQILWENPDPTKSFAAQTINFQNPDNIEDVFLVCAYRTSDIDSLLYYPIKLGKKFIVNYIRCAYARSRNKRC